MTMIVFSSGPYENRLIDDVVLSDPAYVIWAHDNRMDLSITATQVAEALRQLDEWNEDQIDPYDDFDYAQNQAAALGYVPGADNDE